jgi:ABC-2 type transport system permease protein
MSINWFGAFSLFKKEIWRFLKVYHQTLFSPAINVLLMLAVFSLSIGRHIETVIGVPFIVFMSTGLVIMAAMQNSFENGSSSLIMAKATGSIVDYLIPPFSPAQILLAMTMAAIIRGLLVGVVCFGAISFFVTIDFYNFFYALFIIFFSCAFLGLLGLLCGILSENYEQKSAIMSYLITPLTFLSGTFYSITQLPEFWRQIATFNPFFYMIDGFRYGVTGHSDGNLLYGAIYIMSANMALSLIIYYLLKKGYKIIG